MMPTPTRPLHLASVADLPRTYRAILLDQFGCLHDGRDALPGAVEAVHALAATGARVLILSNSSRRASGAVAKLEKLGFDPACFAGALTSGEVAHSRLMVPRPDGGDGCVPSWRGLGTRCLHITWAARGGVSLEGLGLTVVGEEEAVQAGGVDFILVHGTEGVGVAGAGDDPARPPPTARSLEELKALLERVATATARPPPFLCANPDLVTVDGEALVTMPGTLAAWYEAAGGAAVRLGKPAPITYRAALDLLGGGGGIDPRDVLAVGDSLEHDVAGAAAAGMDSLFIGGGIHGESLGLPSGAAAAAEFLVTRRSRPTVDPARLEPLLAASHDVRGRGPTYVMDYLMV